jgi:DNA polymerase-1
MYTIDFETKKIVNGSNKSPRPVGVSIKHNGEPSKYWSWCHPINNNCTKEQAGAALAIAYSSGEKILCHNAKFDLRICLEWFNLPVPEPELINDTMIMAYLIDAREPSLGLKDLAYKYCGIPPDDQLLLKHWILANVKGATESNFGEFISEAPGDIVGKYAESDTDMTYTLYVTLAVQVLGIYALGEPAKQTISDAYQREMRILPIVIDMEMRGISIAYDVHSIRTKLEADFNLMNLQLSAYGNGEKPGSKAMFNVLRKKGLIDERKIQYTAKGNPRYGKDFIEDLVSDKNLTNILKIRGSLQKLISTYYKPFAESALIYNGKYYPYYNQTRSEDDYGTRTGRFSSNIQQLPKNAPETFNDKTDIKSYELPMVRQSIVAGKGKILLKRDFSGQELRVTAHYAEGNMARAYNENPSLDIHSFVDDLIVEKTGHKLSRVPVKVINFLKIYGGGAPLLAKKLSIPVAQAYTFFNAYDSALPEIKKMMADIEKMSRQGIKIRTWGGRSYDVEQSSDGRELYYKLGNVLIQGSSADMTKEAMIRYYYHTDRRGVIFMQVHDEIVVECDEQDVDNEMTLLRWAMDDIPGWDVPLRSDGKVGYNLADMKVYEDVD